MLTGSVTLRKDTQPSSTDVPPIALVPQPITSTHCKIGEKAVFVDARNKFARFVILEQLTTAHKVELYMQGLLMPVNVAKSPVSVTLYVVDPSAQGFPPPIGNEYRNAVLLFCVMV